jgi:hypothetical protein
MKNASNLIEEQRMQWPIERRGKSQTLHRNLKTEQHDPYLKPGVNIWRCNMKKYVC